MSADAGVSQRAGTKRTVMNERCGALLMMFAFGCSGCAVRAPHVSQDALHVTSSSFALDGAIPNRDTCNGSNSSPPLAWGAPPSKTRSFALVVTDRDSPLQFLFGPFVHWIVYNLPLEARTLHENIAALPTLTDGSRQGLNGFDKVGFGGPCPPGSASHRYVFTMYALDSKLDLAPGVKLDTLNAAIAGHVLARGVLVGHYR